MFDGKATVFQVNTKASVDFVFIISNPARSNRIVKKTNRINVDLIYKRALHTPKKRYITETKLKPLIAKNISIINNNKGQFESNLLLIKNKLTSSKDTIVVRKLISNLYEVNNNHCNVIQLTKQKPVVTEKGFDVTIKNALCYDEVVEVGGSSSDNSTVTVTVLVQKNNFIELYLSPKTVTSYSGLPKGLRLSDGRIYGTVLESGEFNVVVKYEDGSASKFLITIPFYQRVL